MELQVSDVMLPEDHPRDTDGDGRSLQFTIHEHDEMAVPRALEVADAEGHWAIYVPLEIDGNMVRSRPDDY